MDINRIITHYLLVCIERRFKRLERQNMLSLLEYFGNELASHDDYHLHVTGSVAECALNASDVDFMLPSRSFSVCDGYSTVAEPCESSPGYVRVRVDDIAALPATIVDCVETWRGRRYIASRRYVEMNSRRIEAGASEAHRHGPAVERPPRSDIHMKNDNVFCLKAVSWPQNAWDHLERFMHVPVFVVPVSHPQSAKPELEWRWSFSLIEREILQNLAPEEIACYGIFKSLKSQFFKEVEGASRLLCSYFIKTGYFWLLQKLQNDHQKPATVAEYTCKLADLLISYYRSGVLPSYFVKEYNLIDTLTESERNTVIHILFDLQSSLPWSVLSLRDAGFFVFTRAEVHKLSQISGIDISSDYIGTEQEQQFWTRVREKQCAERILSEIAAFVNPSNERTQTSVRNRMRNELQNFIDPALPDAYPVPKKPEKVRTALTVCVENIDDILDGDYRQCFRCVLQRAIANSFFFELATTTAADDVHERLKRSAEETYKSSLQLVLPDGFDDLELSGRTALSFFHYCCSEMEPCRETLRPCLRQLQHRDDWLDVCAAAVAQELSRDHHAGMLKEVDQDLFTYVAELKAGGSVFVSSAALAFYLMIATSAAGRDEMQHGTDKWITMFEQLEEHLGTVASGGNLFRDLGSSCIELQRLAIVKHQRLQTTRTERATS